jgi:hypothetical protein
LDNHTQNFPEFGYVSGFWIPTVAHFWGNQTGHPNTRPFLATILLKPLKNQNILSSFLNGYLKTQPEME